MKLYLDNSFLNRPFDNLRIEANRLEAAVLFLIIELVKQERAILINSAVIEYENSLNPFPERKAFIAEVLRLAKSFKNVDAGIKGRAQILQDRLRVQSIDALHLATAETAKVDFFITCDYDVVRKYRGDLKVAAPSGFIEQYENRYRQ